MPAYSCIDSSFTLSGGKDKNYFNTRDGKREKSDGRREKAEA